MLVQMVDITKVYENGVKANDSVCFNLEKGQIHAIAGENGAGKSTVMKILYGLEKPSGGKIFIRGKETVINSPLDAVREKIGYVHQHFMLVNELTVYENIFLGFEKTVAGFLKKSDMINETRKLCRLYKMELDPNKKSGALSVGEAQKVEIIKALSRGAEILILDEPTAVLTPQECEELFIQLKGLAADGKSIVIITHKLKEIKRLCDKVTIMQKGKSRGEHNVADISESDISRLMVGSDVQLVVTKSLNEIGEEIASFQNVSISRVNGSKALDNINFTVREGEIVCLAGVEGNGQREVIATLTGFNKVYEGQVKIQGEDIKKKSISKIRDLAVCHIPEDRMTTGANTNASIYDNIISTSVIKESRFGFIKSKSLKKKAEGLMSEFDIRAESMRQSIGMLSGGNMQKVILARELSSSPKFIIADQPTRGVDVGAIEFIHKRLVEMRDKGCGILLVSADLTEVQSLSDRILVFHNGQITAHIRGNMVSEELLGRYMLGVERQSAAEIGGI